ncbi:MAG: Uma2 family endonuclease [Actinomycetota bacterium]|nr:Uma2 family endonuclease [Actinomycetota bacterium]
MPVQVDPLMPVRPLTVTDVYRMVDAGILDEDDRVELLDGVLVEMTPPAPAHAYAVRTLTMLAVPAAAAAGLEVSVQDPVTVASPINLPQPDLAVVPPTTPERLIADAVLLVEISVTSRRLDLGRKASIYAEGGVPEYWVLDVERRKLVAHRDPVDGRYTRVRTAGEDETVTALGFDLAVPVSTLL